MHGRIDRRELLRLDFRCTMHLRLTDSVVIERRMSRASGLLRAASGRRLECRRGHVDHVGRKVAHRGSCRGCGSSIMQRTQRLLTETSDRGMQQVVVRAGLGRDS